MHYVQVCDLILRDPLQDIELNALLRGKSEEGVLPWLPHVREGRRKSEA
jgi:hypothetical protein